MKAGYWIAHIDVRDPEKYGAYIAASAEALAEYGGRFVVRGGAFLQVEGVSRARHVVVQFPTYERALAAYNSPSYQRARQLREPVSQADITIVEAAVDGD